MVVEKNMDYTAVRRLVAKAYKAGDKADDLWLMASAQRIYDKLEELTKAGYSRFILRVEDTEDYEEISIRGAE